MQVPVYRCSVAVPFKNHAYFDQIRKLLDGPSHRQSIARSIKSKVENRRADIWSACGR